MGDIIKWIFDFLGTVKKWFTDPPVDQFRRIAEAFNNTVPDLVQTISSAAYSRLLGGMIGLSDHLVPVVVVTVTLIVLLTMFGDFSKWLRRIPKALFFYLLFLALLSVILWAALQISEWTKQLVQLIAGTTPGAVASTMANLFSDFTLLGGLENWFGVGMLQIGAFLMNLELQVFKYIALVLLLVYPFVVLFTAFGPRVNSLLHSMHASFATIILSPPVMSLVIMLPHMFSWAGLGTRGTIAAAAMVICTFAASLVPFVIWGVARAKSVKIMGKVEAVVHGETHSTVSGEVDANIKEEPGPLKSFATTALVGSAGLAATSTGEPGGFSRGISHVLLDAVAAGFAAGGNLPAAAALQGVDAGLRRHEQSQQQAPYVPPTPGPLPRP